MDNGLSGAFAALASTPTEGVGYILDERKSTFRLSDSCDGDD